MIWDIDPEDPKAIKDLNNSNLSSKIVDVSNYKEVESSANEIMKNSNIDILINNAGITVQQIHYGNMILILGKK